MDASGWIAVAVATAGATVIAVMLASLSRGIPAEPSGTGRTVAVSLLIGVAGSVAWLVIAVPFGHGVPGGLLPVVAALAAVAAQLVALPPRATAVHPLRALLFASTWSLAVFAPVAIAVFSIGGPFELLGTQPLDHGGALAVFVASGAASAAVIIFERRARAREFSDRVSSAGLLILIGVWAAWALWLGFMELAIDEVTPRIIVNSIAAPMFGVVGWLAVQRMRHLETTVPAAAAGLLSGLTAVTAGAAFLDPLWASVTGFAGGAASAVFAQRRVHFAEGASRFMVGTTVIAPAVGLVLLGLFANGIGLVFTGQTYLVQSQVVATVLVIVYSALVSALLWSLIRLIPDRTSEERG